MRSAVAFLLLLSLAGTGCTYTVPGATPPARQPALPSFHPTVEYTSAEFTFALNQRQPKPSPFDGHRLGREIMTEWEARPFVRAARLVDDGRFSGGADYTLTLTGSMRGETSFGWQLVNALTLMLSPYSVTQTYDLQVVLEDVRDGKRYEASVQATDETWVEIFLVLALPWAEDGHRETIQRVGDDLYEQFRRQGVFDRQVDAGGLGADLGGPVSLPRIPRDAMSRIQPGTVGPSLNDRPTHRTAHR